jgi:hypothetical protein
MENKGTKWIPDEPEINKHEGDQTDQEKPEDSTKHEKGFGAIASRQVGPKDKPKGDKGKKQ